MALSLAADLRGFLDSSESHEIVHAGALFCCRALGAGPFGLLLLPGAVADGDAHFALAPLAASPRLVAIAYPDVADLGTLVDGLAAIVDRDGPRRHRHRRRFVRWSRGAGAPGAVFRANPPRRAVGDWAGGSAARRAQTDLPGAQVHAFAGSDHVVSAERPREWAASIAAFLDD